MKLLYRTRQILKLILLIAAFVGAVLLAVNWRTVFGHADEVDSKVDAIGREITERDR